MTHLTGGVATPFAQAMAKGASPSSAPAAPRRDAGRMSSEQPSHVQHSAQETFSKPQEAPKVDLKERNFQPGSTILAALF